LVEKQLGIPKKELGKYPKKQLMCFSSLPTRL